MRTHEQYSPEMLDMISCIDHDFRRVVDYLFADLDPSRLIQEHRRRMTQCMDASGTEGAAIAQRAYEWYRKTMVA